MDIVQSQNKHAANFKYKLKYYCFFLSHYSLIAALSKVGAA